MEITIEKGSIDFIDECENALLNSELGMRYFSEKGSAIGALKEGFAKKEIYIALDSNHNCKGFIWFILDGAFHSFPYLHIIAVTEQSRNQGIGKKLLQFFEDVCFKDNTKLFLVVADFNPAARKLYEKIGYVKVGNIPSLYREGITENLMMKSKPKNK